jgi:uroporphyrinogen-III synthase
VNSRTGILVIREEGPFSSTLRENGHDVFCLPLIDTRTVVDERVVERLKDLPTYDGLFFTSPAAVRGTLENAGPTISDFAGDIYVVGERARVLLQSSGLAVKEPVGDSAESLLTSFGCHEFAGRRLLFIRGDRSLDKISESLQGCAEVHELIVYKTIERDVPADEIIRVKKAFADGAIDWTCFFSPSAVEAFVVKLSSVDRANFKVAAVGETTAQHARDAGFDVRYVADHPSAAAFAHGLSEEINAAG